MVFDLNAAPGVQDLIRRAKDAQSKYSRYTQEQVDHIIKKVAEVAYKKSAALGRMAVEETGMGIAEHKQLKNELCSTTLYESIKDEKTVGIINEDYKNKITEVAAPFGVVACIIPTTNPTSTAIFKTLIALKTLNAIVVSPHPSAVNCTIEALKICNQAALEAGAPDGLINWIAQPSLDATTELMHHEDVDLILATGGAQLVRAAYSSGKPAYGVGPGNVPVYLEKTANVQKAVKKIVDSKSFDNGTICSTEQAVVVDSNVKQMTIREFKNNGAYFLKDSEKVKIENVISPTRGKLNPKIVGKSANVIAQMAGFRVPDETRVLMAEESRIANDVPLSIEKLSPILPIYTVDSIEEAEKTCLEILENGGKGHTMSLHSNDETVIRRFGLSMPASRVMVNTLSSIGAAGATSGLMPSMTLGCGSYGRNITSDNITARHLINIKRIAQETNEVSIPRPTVTHETINPTFNVYERGVVNESPNSSVAEDIVQQVLQNVSAATGSFDKDTITKMIHNVMKNTKEERTSFYNQDPIKNNSFSSSNNDDKVKQTLQTMGLNNNAYNPDMIAKMVQDIVRKS